MRGMGHEALDIRGPLVVLSFHNVEGLNSGHQASGLVGNKCLNTLSHLAGFQNRGLLLNDFSKKRNLRHNSSRNL